MGDQFLKKFRPEKFYEHIFFPQESVLLRRYGPLIVGPEIYLNVWRSKLHLTEEKLKAKRLEYIEKRIGLDEQWNAIAENGLSFKESINNFNQFVIDNNEKRKRATQYGDHYKKIIETKEKEIKKMTENINSIKEALQTLYLEVDSHKIYENYLNNVLEVDNINQFKNPDGIVERFEFYQELSRHLADKQAADFIELQEAKQNLAKFEEVHKNILLGLHTQAASLRGRLEICSRKTHEMENLIRKIKDISYENYMDIKHTREGLWNLYVQMCRKKTSKPKIPKEDFENQLLYVSTTLKQYQKLNQLLKDMAEQAKKSKKK